jgi:hypothetical protein
MRFDGALLVRFRAWESAVDHFGPAHVQPRPRPRLLRVPDRRHDVQLPRSLRSSRRLIVSTRALRNQPLTLAAVAGDRDRKRRSPLTFRSSGFDRTTISRRRGRCQPGRTICLPERCASPRSCRTSAKRRRRGLDSTTIGTAASAEMKVEMRMAGLVRGGAVEEAPPRTPLSGVGRSRRRNRRRCRLNQKRSARPGGRWPRRHPRPRRSSSSLRRSSGPPSCRR